jgi:uncharacterized protein with ParB-like and HNH nuclease domain
MEDPFKPQSLTIGELYGNKDSLYKIPQYQRPYKWEDEQIYKLWDDIYEAWENEEANYFLGSIITAKPRDDEGSAYVDVVDGQQRLTTLMILFCVVRDLYPDINKEKVQNNPLAVDMDSLLSSITMHGKAKRLRLYTHKQHQSDFDNIILDGNTLCLSKPYKYQIRTDEEPKYKFINTATIFKEKLEELGETDSAELINFLFNQVKIIRIDCVNREFAIKLFQVLNDRGMDLTAADLIKSYLIEKLYTTHKEDKDTLKQKEEQFIADWREMEQNVKDLDISLNDLFIIYEYYILGQNPRKSLYEELQTVFKDKDPNKIISDIKQFASSYHKNIWESTNKNIYAFWYIRWSMYWKAILLTAIHTKYKHFDNLTVELKRFYYLYWIAGKTLSQIKQASFNLIKWIKEKKSISFIKKELRLKLKTDKILDLALNSLDDSFAANEAWCKPLLILCEYNATDNSNPNFIELSKDLHLEHILPKGYKKYKEWNHISPDTASTWLNSLGNLTLLSGAKNIEASNNPFNIKIHIYKGKGKHDNKDEKVTAFRISQSIVDDFNSKKFGKQWNEKSINARWSWVLDEVEEILDIDCTKIR